MASSTDAAKELRQLRAENKRLQQQSQLGSDESDENFRRLAELSPDMIYRIRLLPKRVVEYVSPACLPMTGYTPDEMTADPDLITSLTHPDDRALADYFIRDHPEARGPFVVRWIRRDGKVIWTERYRVPIEDEQGRVVAVQGFVRDITERMRAEQELESLRRDFLGMISHELKTPLTAVKGAAAMALGSSRPLSTEDSNDLFQIINEQADKLRDLVDSLLDMTRIEAHSFTINTEPGNLLPLIEKLRNTLVQSNGRVFTVDAPEKLAQVMMDERRVEQVLSNLLSNAAKFSPAGTPVLLTVTADKEFVTVSVKDQGLGIKAEMLPELFQKFSRVHNEVELNIAGTGLGLAICKAIIEAHGGRIWAESEGPGKGATFSFTLPVATPPVATAPATPASQSESQAPSVTSRGDLAGRVRRAGERTKVLAVDDDMHIRRLLQRSLESGGYNAITVANPADAVEMIEYEEPDLVLLDMRLPGTTGLDLLKRIREFSGVPVMFITGNESQEDVIEALREGADDYVTKPFSPPELLARIEAVLRRRLLGDTIEVRPPFTLGDLAVNFAERGVSVKGKQVSLSATEYKILFELATNAGKVLTYDQLLHHVWGPEYSGESTLVRSFIRDLRRKLGDDAQSPTYILTERGVGYRMPKSV